MYIAFHLPKGASGAAASIAITHIDIDIDYWVTNNNIQHWKCKLHKYTYRLCLAQDLDYTHFALTWNPKYPASRNFEFRQPK